MYIKFADSAEGLHKARLSEIKEQKGMYGQYLKLLFTVEEGMLTHFRFSGTIKPTPLKQSKFYRWITNILGEEPPGNFCTEDMIGRECLICLSKQKGYYIVSDVLMEDDGKYER